MPFLVLSAYNGQIILIIGVQPIVLADFVDALANAFDPLLDTFGLFGVVLIAFLENMFPPTPSEYLYPLAGRYAAQGDLSVIGVIAAGVFGSLVGSLLYYALGYALGPERMRVFVERYGRIQLWRFSVTFITVDAYDRALDWLERRGPLFIVIGRNLPVIHSMVSIPAGVARMPLGRFLLFTSIGVMAWVAPLTLFGYILGNNWEQVLVWLDAYQMLWYGLIALFVVFWLVNRWLKKRRSHLEQSAYAEMDN